MAAASYLSSNDKFPETRDWGVKIPVFAAGAGTAVIAK
jgi:hypothetical protein